MGLEGFSNNASGGMSPGEHLYAKTFNKLATAADKAQMGPSEGVIFTATNGGIGLYISQPPPQEGGIIQQFQIFVEPYAVGENTSDFSIIRVVKGEVVWKPQLATESIIPTATCTTQTTIENWFALPTFPVIDDQNSVYIGDGGIRVPNTDGLEVGIFIFKANGLVIDVPPIIVAAPNYTPACPVVFPGTPPVADAIWEVVQIGSAIRDEGNWYVDQKFIGSMTLPGGGGGGTSPTTPLLPAQLVTQVNSPQRSPFECVIVQVNDKRYLRIVNGTISYSASNMPLIKTGAFTHTKQAWATKVQICPEGMRTENIYPSFDPDPQFNNYWMENEGGYELFDTNDPITLYAFKWDVDTNVPPFMDNAVVNTGLPTLAILAQSNSDDIQKITKDSGPSIYQQTMNIQRMTGYDAADTELAGDWGHCHTTWLNPRKIGYNYKAIAAVIANENSFSCIVSSEQVGAPNLQNSVQTIRLLGDAKDGFIVFSFTWNGTTETSTVPFYVTDIYTPFEVIASDELALQRTLNSIPALEGNVQVSKSDPSTYHVAFINELQGQVIPLLVSNTDNVTAFDYRFDVIQYHTGNLDLTTPMQFGMTQLMNKDGVTESEDPYNLNKESDPPWKDICNKDDVLACSGFSGDVTTLGMTNMSGFTDNNPDYTIEGGCDGDSSMHPFKVINLGNDTFKVVAGTIDDLVPQLGITADSSRRLDSDPAPTETWNFNESNYSYIYLKVGCDTTTNAFPVSNQSDVLYPRVVSVTSEQASDDDSGYLLIATAYKDPATNKITIWQYIRNSEWADRIKIGTTAKYFFAAV